MEITQGSAPVIPGTGAANLGKAIDSVAGGTDTGVAILVVRDDTLTTLTPADGDYTLLRVGSKGELHVTGGGSVDGPGAPAIDSYTHVAINLTTGADQVLASSAANKQIWIYGYAFTCGDADGQTVSLQDEDNVAITGIMEFAQYGGIARNPSGNFAMPLYKLATNKDLEIDITGGDVDGSLEYAVVSV